MCVCVCALFERNKVLCHIEGEDSGSHSTEAVLSPLKSAASPPPLPSPPSGHTTYEVKATDVSAPNTTCLATCRASSGCAACGRPNCKGTLCDQCANSCWTIDPPVIGGAVLYVSPTYLRTASCSQKWQLVWNVGSVLMFPEHTSGTYRMQVLLKYADVDRQAFFSNVKFSGTYLTVGKFDSGPAGNGWGAPFVNRKSNYTSMSNLHPFFYPPGTVSAEGVESYEDQMARNATTITRGYYWAHQDAAIAGTVISRISLWISP